MVAVTLKYHLIDQEFWAIVNFEDNVDALDVFNECEESRFHSCLNTNLEKVTGLMHCKCDLIPKLILDRLKDHSSFDLEDFKKF
jgi:hypothetical protein